MSAPAPSVSNRVRLAGFVGVFLLLYAATQSSASFQRLFIEQWTVPIAAWTINALGLTGAPVVAAGARLVAPGGGLNVLQGCEGLDLLCLWLAAMAVGPFTWRGRLLGVTLGTLIVFGLNQVRLLSLFHIFRTNREGFGDAHGLWWPLLLVGLVWVLFALWQRGFGRPLPAPAAAA